MTQGVKPTIRPVDDGPYMVKGLEKLANQKGPIASRDTIALCRCGRSANKPFCDGSHVTAGFASAKLEGRTEDKRDDYAGEHVTIHDNRGLCAHAGHCTDGVASVFRLRQEPWIDPDGATGEEIGAAIRKCPSGALSYTVEDVEQSDTERDPAVFVAPNGPYVVTGGPDLLDTEWGHGASKEHFTLCRCGGSKNKPFCDGSHWRLKFSDEKN